MVPSLKSLLAAALWASYYVIVLLAAPFVAPSAILVYPFVVGGVALPGLHRLPSRRGRLLGFVA